jgi:hypothetical protein
MSAPTITVDGLTYGEHMIRNMQVERDEAYAASEGYSEGTPAEVITRLREENGRLGRERDEALVLRDSSDQARDTMAKMLADSHEARVQLGNEVERLRLCLGKANEGFEVHERLYYLTLDERDQMRAVCDAAVKLRATFASGCVWTNEEVALDNALTTLNKTKGAGE